MERFQSWVALTALSLVVVGALFDEVPDSRNGKTDFALVAAFASLILGAFFSASNIVDSLRNRFVGNIFENAMACIIMALWVIAIAFIQNPANSIATSIENGTEQINYANLYFFSWLTFLAAIYTVGVTFRDNFHFGPQFGQWMLLFTASIVLMSTAISSRGDICKAFEGMLQCDRVKYAVAVGAVGLSISAIAVLLSVCDKMSRAVELLATGLSTILYFFGVIFLTSASGPAKVMGNMYFSLWGGCFVSFVLLIGALFPGSSEVEVENNNASHEEDQI